MDSWKSLLIVFALVALFSMALLNGIGILQLGNGVNNSIFTSPVLSQFNSSIYSNLTNLKQSTDSQSDQIIDETNVDVTPQGDLTLGAILHSIPTFAGFLYGFAGGLFVMLQQTLGINSIVIIVLGAILVIITILLFWRLYKIGQ